MPLTTKLPLANTFLAVGSTASSQDPEESTEEHHFYNVLWIECKDGIAYRRAAGRIPKAIWENNSPELSEIILG